MTRTRRGFTLVEILVVLVVLSAVLTTIGLTMHTLLQSSRDMQDAFRTRRQIERFTWQLRADAHQATAAVAAPDDGDSAMTILQLTCRDSTRIEYKLEPERIIRTERRGGKVIRQESYPIAAAREPGWRVNSKRATPLVRLLIRTPTRPRKMRLQLESIRIVTAVNLYGGAENTRGK